MTAVRDTLTRIFAPVWEFFWEIALGIVVLWLFFLIMGGISFDDPLWLTIAIAVLAVAAAFHIWHIRSIVEHDTDLSRRAHRLRERRGF